MAPNLDVLATQYARLQKPFLQKFQQYLTSLKGKEFETPSAAQAEYRKICRNTKRLGQQILYESKPVTLRIAYGPGSRHVTFQVLERSNGRRIAIYTGTGFPALTFRQLS